MKRPLPFLTAVLMTSLHAQSGQIHPEGSTTSNVLSWTKKELSALTGGAEPVEAVKKARQLLKLANPNSNSNCKFQLIQEQTTNSEFPSIFLKLESGSQKYQATILSDGYDIGVRITKDSLEIGPGLGDTHGTEFTIQWNREFELIEIKASTRDGLIQHQLYCGFQLK